MARLTRLILVVAVGALLLLSSCAGGVDGPVIEGSRSLSGTDALIEGALQIEGDCIYLSHPDTAGRYPIVWPHGTSWNENESAVRLADGTLVHEGDTVSGGGGYPYVSELGSYTNSDGHALAQECVDNTYNEIAVFNSGGDLVVYSGGR